MTLSADLAVGGNFGCLFADWAARSGVLRTELGNALVAFSLAMLDRD